MIANMSDNMSRDGYVNYAKTRLTPPLNKESYIARLYRLYSSGKLLKHRYYFHGRFFAIKGWYVPTDSEVANIQNKKNKLSQVGGLSVDDIFLSTYILKKYGTGAINELNNVYVYAKPITSVRDWYYTYRRTVIEIKKILLLFPEFSDVRKYHYRKTDWGEWIKSSLNIKLYWLSYLAIISVFRLLVFAEILLVRMAKFKTREQWIRVASTKGDRRSDNVLVLLDVDGTLSQGEKNLYYKEVKLKNILKSMIEKGVVIGLNSSRDNLGVNKIYTELRLNGPIISEGGANISIGDDSYVPISLFNLNLKGHNLIKIIKNATKPFGEARGLKHSCTLKLEIDKDLVEIKVSSSRDYSGSIYVYTNNKPSEKYQSFLHDVLERYLKNSQLTVEKSRIIGKLYVYSQNISKLSSALIAREKFYISKKLYIIGNDEAAHIPDIKGVYFMGVKDSEVNYKLKCDYVSNEHGLEGLMDILNKVKKINGI